MTVPTAVLPTRADPAHLAWSCTNCGHWQRWFASGPPPTCPVCVDVRNALPSHGFEFVSEHDMPQRTSTHCREVMPGVTEFWCDPPVGLGSHGWVIDSPAGPVGFECAPWYSPDTIDRIRQRGGLAVLASSHVHGYGALWQLQDALDPPVVSVGVRDLVWTKAFRVTWPADDELELAPGLRLLRTGGHFAGHSVLHDSGRGYLFCGDSLKVDLDEAGRATHISAHKAFHAQIPLSHGELRSYREVIGALDFTTVFTPFEHAEGVTTRHVLALVDRLLSGPPSASPVALEELA